MLALVFAGVPLALGFAVARRAERESAVKDRR